MIPTPLGFFEALQELTGADAVLEFVDGVKANTAAKGSESFEVTGDFNDQEVFAALQKAGLNGKAGK